MKTFLLSAASLIFVFSITAKADDQGTTQYYIGESIVTMANGDVSRAPYIIARTSDPVASTISETVVTRKQVGFREDKSTINISGNHFTLSEITGTVTGGGELTGTAWNWTFLRADFNAPKYDLHIVDYNFFADPNAIAGHKDFFNTSGPKEVRFMQEDVVVHPVDQKTFEMKRKELLGL